MLPPLHCLQHGGDPVAGHLDSRDITQLSIELADRRLDDLTAALRADAIERAGGELRDDLVVLVARPTEVA